MPNSDSDDLELSGSGLVAAMLVTAFAVETALSADEAAWWRVLSGLVGGLGAGYLAFRGLRLWIKSRTSARR